MVKFALIRETKVPTRGTQKSAGIDIYVPKFTESFIKAFNARNLDAQSQALFDTAHSNINIRPHGRVFIPSGLLVNFQDLEDSALIAFNKSSTSWECRLTLLATTIDQDYSGEIFITMENFSDYPTILLQDQKLTQIIRIPTFYDKIEIVDKDSIFTVPTERGSGSMGSTNKD
jgi:dUTPase